MFSRGPRAARGALSNSARPTSTARKDIHTFEQTDIRAAPLGHGADHHAHGYPRRGCDPDFGRSA